MSLNTTISMINNVSPILNNIIDSMNLVISSAYKLNDNTENMIDTSSLNTSLDLLRDAQEEIISLDNSTINLEKEHRDYNSTISKSEGLLNNIEGKIIGIVGAYVGLRGIKSLINLGDNFTGIDARLSFMLKEDEKIEDVQSKIAIAAKNSRTSYIDMADSVAKLKMLTGDVFSSFDEAVRFSEILNKNFKVGGASVEEQSAAMYQLTQAMASGRLQGDEFVSIRENAPLLANAIAETMGVSIGELKKLSTEGAITADVIKKAMFESASDIETRFKSIPKTFSDLKTELINTLFIGLKKPLSRLNDFINTASFQNFFNSLINGIMLFSNFTEIAIDLFVSGFSLIGNILDVIGAPLMGIVSIFALYNMILAIHNGIVAVTSTFEFLMARAMSLYAIVTGKATSIQAGFNTALLSSPLFFIPAIIILVVSLIYGVVAAINKVKGTTISATGIIVGSVSWVCATIINIAIGAINGIIQLVYSLISPIISVVEWILNVSKGGFDSFGDACKNLISNIISWFLDLGKVVTKIIDAIFGTDWTEGLNSLQEEVLKSGKNEEAITLSTSPPQIERIDAGKWYENGYKWGEDKINSLKNFSSDLVSNKEIENSINPDNFLNTDEISEPLNGILDNTESMNDKMKNSDWENNNLSSLKNLMEERAINDLSKEIKLEIHNEFSGDMKSDVDAKKIIDESSKKLIDDLIKAINGG